MNKDEIISNMAVLKRKISSKGRKYSATQRADMKKEFEHLAKELANFELLESINFIKVFENKHPLKLKPERESLKNKLDDVLIGVDDFRLKYILSLTTKPLYKELEYWENSYKEIESLREALDFIERGEEIPFPNAHHYQEVELIQRSLSGCYVSANAKFDKLFKSVNQIELIKDFFLTNNQLKAFVYLTKALFTEATDFSEGYGKVAQGSNKMIFTSEGEAYKVDIAIDKIPKIKSVRSNPDLIPFEIEVDYFNRLMGFKNTSGQIIIPPKYSYTFPFVNGFAKVGILKKGWSKHTYGLIDETGNEVLPCEFIELGDVFNDVVLYKKHIVNDIYVRANSYSFDMKRESQHLGLFNGYLIFKEIRPALDNVVDEIFKTENEIKNLKTNGEVDKAQEQILHHEENIRFYLSYIFNLPDRK